MKPTRSQLLFWVALASLSMASPASAQQSTSSPSILGQWHGQSICVKADWNASCHDEEVLYDFEASAGDSDQAVVHAFKRVNNAFEPMGDIAMHRDPATGEWIGEFANDRVHIRWSYRVDGTTLTGWLVELPSLRRARDVKATRQPAGELVVPQY